jgi:putative pectin methyltransferase
MSKPLYRGFSGGGRSSSGNFSSSGLDPIDPAEDNSKGKEFQDNGFGHELSNITGIRKMRKDFAIFLFKLGAAVITIVALVSSLSWAISISTSSKGATYHGYRRLQEQLIADLLDFGELSLGISKSKEVEFCAPHFENYVPCYYNISDTDDLIDTGVDFQHERTCLRDSGVNCLILPPRNYRIPLRWPSGKDFIWKENVKITGQEFSSGSLTKR